MPTIEDVRPPYVTFEYKPIEDRDGTIAAGHPVFKNVAYAMIYPAGSKDRVEIEAEQWFSNLRQRAEEDRIPDTWPGEFRKMYERWLNNEAIPENGFPLKLWPGIDPSTVKTCLSFSIRTVEDLAEANEEMINRLGMGGRSLVAKAKAYLKTSIEVGTSVEAIEALKVRNAELQMQVTNQAEQISLLKARLDSLEPRKGKEEEPDMVENLFK